MVGAFKYTVVVETVVCAHFQHAHHPQPLAMPFRGTPQNSSFQPYAKEPKVFRGDDIVSQSRSRTLLHSQRYGNWILEGHGAD
jgi:hypothetical protein